MIDPSYASKSGDPTLQAGAPTKTFADVALPLRANGYNPIPVDGKRPLVRGWQNAVRYSETRLQDLSKRFPQANAGIVLGQNILAIDIDISNCEPASLAADIVQEHLSGKGLIRIGRAPRRLILCRITEPLGVSKIGEIDMLTGARQFVAYGIHPDTRGHYQWTGDDPLHSAVSSLPVLNPTAAAHLVNRLRQYQGITDCADTCSRPRPVVPQHASLSGNPSARPRKGARNKEVFLRLKDFAIDVADLDSIRAEGRRLGHECEPPLPEAEIESIIKSVLRYKEEGRLLRRGIKKLVIAESDWLAVRSVPAALDLLMWLKATRPPTAQAFTIPQMATALKMQISANTLRRAIRHLLSTGVLVRLEETKRSGPGKRPACLYRLTTHNTAVS